MNLESFSIILANSHIIYFIKLSDLNQLKLRLKKPEAIGFKKI